ncbi:MAG: hypothetical protein MRY63_04560 [Neomegalonema sp.]|nr:hypothetical protein [Neomegalonema sp.]
MMCRRKTAVLVALPAGMIALFLLLCQPLASAARAESPPETPPASAQAAECNALATRCAARINPACLQRLGAGSISADETAALDCDAQYRDYRDCLKQAVSCRPDAPARGTGQGARAPCSEFVEQTLFEAARKDPERRGDFESACPNSPLLALLPRNLPASQPVSPPVSPPVPQPISPEPERAHNVVAARTSRIEARSGATQRICGGTELVVTVWKRSASVPSNRATVKSPLLSEPVVISIPGKLALATSCTIWVERAGFRGYFFTEIEVVHDAASPSQ